MRYCWASKALHQTFGDITQSVNDKGGNISAEVINEKFEIVHCEVDAKKQLHVLQLSTSGEVSFSSFSGEKVLSSNDLLVFERPFLKVCNPVINYVDVRPSTSNLKKSALLLVQDKISPVASGAAGGVNPEKNSSQLIKGREVKENAMASIASETTGEHVDEHENQAPISHVECPQAVWEKDGWKGASVEASLNSKFQKEYKEIGAKSASNSQKVDKFGRLVKEGVSDSDSDDLRYNGKQKKRGRSRSRPPLDQWRMWRSPWRRREKRSRSCSWSPRNQRSRSRSPRNQRSRSRSPRNQRSRGRSPKIRRSRSRSPRSRHLGDFSGDSMRWERGQIPQCFDFRRGRCYRGASCRYLHHDNDKGEGSKHQRSWNRSPFSRHVGDFSGESRRWERGQIPECFDFRRGRCYRGASCRYLHHDNDKGEGSMHQRSKQPCFEVPPILKNSNTHESNKHNLSKAADKECYEAKITEMQHCEIVSGSSFGRFIDSHTIKSGSSREAASKVPETQILEGLREGPTTLINNIWQASIESQHSKLVVGFPHTSQKELPVEKSVVKQSQSNLSDPVQNASSKDGGSVESSSGLKEKTSDYISDHDFICKYPKQNNVIKDDRFVNETYKEENCQDSSHSVPIRACIAHSKRKLLVLDVNGILAAIAELPVREGWTPHYLVSRKAVFKRPYCVDFLQFCFERFNVGIWTSRVKKNVERAVQFLLGGFRHHLLFCWDASHCSQTGLTAIENQNKPLVLKELKKLWMKADCGLPWREGEFNETNTLLVDDSPYKALRNPAYTAIFPYSYQYWDTEDKSLGPGGDLREYLERLSHAENVQEFVRQNPFGQPPINESNPHWSYYSQVFCTDEGNTCLFNTNVGHETPEQTLTQIVSDPQ